MSDIIKEMAAYAALSLEVKEALAAVHRITYEPPSGEPSGQTITWRGECYEVPSDAEIEDWVFNSLCETPDGCQVESDHLDSWLSLLGLI